VTEGLERKKVEDVLREAGVPAAQVATPEDRIEHDPARRSGTCGRGAPRRDRRRPCRGHTDAPVGDRLVDRTGAPCIGNDNDFVYGELLGLAPGETRRLRSGSDLSDPADHAIPTPTGLDGLRVVELANDRCANGAKLLGNLGADVIVVEPPGGHVSRTYGPFAGDQPDPDRCLWWWNYNTSKRSIVLDFQTDDGRGTFRRLAASADVVIEAEDPGMLDALGIDHTQIRAEHPELVWVSVTPFGRMLPQYHEPITDLTQLAGAGTVWNCGYDDHTLPPVRPSGNHSVHTASSFAVLGVHCAGHRDLTGIGQHVDVSMHARQRDERGELGRVAVRRRRCSGRPADASASDDGDPGPAGDGRYVPRRCATAGPTSRQRRLVRELGLEEEFPEAFFLQMGSTGWRLMKSLGSTSRRRDLRRGREAICFIAPKTSAIEFFVQAQTGIPCGAVWSAEEALADEHFRSRGTRPGGDPSWVAVTYPGLPSPGRRSDSITRAPLVGSTPPRSWPNSTDLNGFARQGA
jgi:crotonobetainyl-CoA:carnitine CoA-transferase CaiB-like acyl-CoA transferase